MTPQEELLVARGARARSLRRLIRQSDARAQRRLRLWLEAVYDRQGTPEKRRQTADLYVQAERLMDRLMAARYGGMN